MKRRSLEETLLALGRVRESPGTEESRQELRRVLREEGSHAVARAATVVVEGRPELKDALARAFGRPVR